MNTKTSNYIRGAALMLARDQVHALNNMIAAIPEGNADHDLARSLILSCVSAMHILDTKPDSDYLASLLSTIEILESLSVTPVEGVLSQGMANQINKLALESAERFLFAISEDVA